MSKHFLILIFIPLLMSCMNKGNRRPIGMSPEIFYDTPGWKAALAIMEDDTVSLGRELENDCGLRTLKDPYYGFSLLFTAVLNNKEKSTEKLLKFGFDPNLVSDTLRGTGSTPVTAASYHSTPSPRVLELLLQFGGDPDSKQRFSLRLKDFNTRIQDTINRHAIADAARNNFEKVKLLLKYGADINPGEGTSPLDMAISLDKMEIALYLLENGADYNEKYEAKDVDSQQSQSRGYATVADKLRYVMVPLDSREYGYKLKVIDFLKERGLDYHDTEIPEHALKLIKRKYPDIWEEYIKEY